MRILQCHNLYQQPGGEDRVVEDERALLESHGHEVVVHTVHNDDVGDVSKPRLAGRTVWSRSSAKKLRELVRRHRPDVAHFHNTLPLMSPSSYYAVRAEGVPVVQTLHNYRLLCPKATFFRDQQICEDCLTKTVKWPAVLHSCYRESRAASAAVAVMLTVHNQLRTYHREVDAYIACSPFSRKKLIEGGYPGERIHLKSNFVNDAPEAGTGRGGYAMFLGRLSPEKGVDVLVRTWKRLSGRPLLVVGDGPQSELIKGLAASEDLVRYEARVSGSTLIELLRDAAFLVLPSMTYEGFPKVIAEAYACGLPVVASNIGAMRDIVVDGETGRHFRYGDDADLARVCTELFEDPAQLRKLRHGARNAFETSYTAETNYVELMAIYRMAQKHFDRGHLTRKQDEVPADPKPTTT